ncbi:MAG: hypothetical protein ABJA71_16320 [Ginsengibacter sp.]
MKRILLILILQNFATGKIHSQSFNVKDLLALASLPSKNIDNFMSKKGFALSSSKMDSDTLGATFIIKVKGKKSYIGPARSIDMYLKDDSKYFDLHTTSLNEYLDGQRGLIKSGFFYDDKKDISKVSAMLFQKANITIQATSGMQEGVPQYSFKLREVEIPSSVMYAEELLQFNSHEYLASFFGVLNVKKDMYYFSEKDLKKCSVLYSGTRRQAVFVWGDENNLNNLSYILVTNILPTSGAAMSNPLSGNNEWIFKNGIHAGMAIKDLLKINEMDFNIYGNESDLAFMVKPEEKGKIDFNKTAVMLACSSCFDNAIFKQKTVSALDVAKANLPMRVYDVIIYPSYR